MKKILTVCMACLLINNLYAQVKIGSPGNPHASSVLELDGGTNKGLLLPRMTKANMLAIPAPAEGLSVYVTDEQALYLRRSGNWSKLSEGGGLELPLDTTMNVNGAIFRIANEDDNGTAIRGSSFMAGYGVIGYSTHGVGIYGQSADPGGVAGYFWNFGGADPTALIAIGKTGLGTHDPLSVLHVDGKDVSGNTVIIDDDVDPIIQLRHAGVSTGYFQSNGMDVRTGTNATNSTGSFIVRNNGADRFFINNDGNVGIGLAPQARLYVDAIGTSSTAVVINDQDPIVQLENSGVGKGFVQLVGDDIKLGINQSNSNGNIIFRAGNADRIKINSSGHMGIGDDPEAVSRMLITASPSSGEAHINMQSTYSGTYGPGLRFSGTSPSTRTLGTIFTTSGAMEFNSGTAATPNGFKFRAGDEEALRIGTTGNAAFANRLAVGSLSPDVLFHVDGYRDGVNSIANEIVRVQGVTPLMQFMHNTSKIGYIATTNQNFIIGTNIENNSGQFVIRTNGANQVWIDQYGDISFGPDMYKVPSAINGYKMAVKGLIAATDFAVRATSTWPDYVFEPGYNLKPLNEVEAFIKQNKHLPNIPSAADIEKEGYLLGHIQKRMMEKIEELTLHLIEADKKITALTEKINKLENKQ